MIEQASRGPRKPGVSPKIGSEDDVALHMPRASQDAEEAERGRAARTVVRMLLGRHDCPRLPACEAHGQKACDCHPCRHPDHAEDAALAGEALQSFGLSRG
jgi:hypothetical protein